MGYVKNTHMCQYIYPWQIGKSAGTWTPSTLTTGSYTSGSIAADVRTAGDSAFNLYIPVPTPTNSTANKGTYLVSIDVFYTVATAALDSITSVNLIKAVYPTTTGTSGSIAGTLPAITVDTGNDTTAERITVGQHTLTATLDTPAWVDDYESYTLVVAVDAAATSAFHLHGARANFTLAM
jgi:hypothetical protein